MRSAVVVRACACALIAAAALVASARDDARLGATRVRFASVAEGQAVLARSDAWVRATEATRAAVLGVKPPVCRLSRLLAFSAATALLWQADQEARWRRALESIGPRLLELGVPLPDEVLLINTDGRDAAGRGPTTRGRAVVLPSAAIPSAPSGPGDALLLAHELFHVVSRHDPALATRLYRTIGFETAPPLRWPAAWLPLRIAGTHAPFDHHAMPVAIDGRATRVMPVLVAKRAELAPGESFFSVMDVRLLEVTTEDGRTLPVLRDGQPLWHAPGRVSEVPRQARRQHRLHHPSRRGPWRTTSASSSPVASRATRRSSSASRRCCAGASYLLTHGRGLRAQHLPLGLIGGETAAEMERR